MLGIFLILCLTVYIFIDLKAYYILKDDTTEPVELNNEGHTYKVCYRAVKLIVLSYIVILVGYLGCMSPYLFIEGIETKAYITGIISFGLAPVLLMAYICYLCIRGAQGYIRISTEEIEYKRRKSFSVKVSDIKKVVHPSTDRYQIRLKEKGERPLFLNTTDFYNRKEIRSLMKQLRGCISLTSGQENTHPHKTSYFSLGCGILGRSYIVFVKIALLLILFYTSYCCIDYDFFRNDYIAQYNALGADSSQTENAWGHYVQAAVNYEKMEDDLQEVIDDGLCSGQLEITDDQKEPLEKWFDDNASSWASLKKAVSIDYCNATHEHISILDRMDRDDFSSPSDTGYGQIKQLYHNADAGRLVGIIDIDWFDLFQMQLISSKHFVNGKSIMDQLVGYALLARSVKLLSKQDSYELEDMENARKKLNKHFPIGIPPLNIEGETLVICSSISGMINQVKIPTQTPLNPMFLALGSTASIEKQARKNHMDMLRQAQEGVEVESDSFSIIGFPIMAKMMFSILDPSIARIYEISQRAETYLPAAYFLLDLEEYQLMKGCYPVDVSQLDDAGLTSQLPNDPYTDGKIIYSNDGNRAILYAVGRNGKDDGGYKDDKKSDKKRDDIIYWERNLEEVSEIETGAST